MASTLSSAVAVTGVEAASLGVAAVIGSGVTNSGLTLIEGFKSNDEAKTKITSAKQMLEEKINQEEKEKKLTYKKLESLNLLKLEIYSNDIKNSIEIIKKIHKNTKEGNLDFLDKTNLDMSLTNSEIDELNLASNEAKYILKTIATGSNIVSTLSKGSFGYLTNFGIASTGVPISSLSGAAATNASLAMLGGGSLATGGGGMALGSAILGGISILPAAMILSYKYAQKAEESLTNATKYYSDVIKEVENRDLNILNITKGLNPRIDELKQNIEQFITFYRAKIYPDLLNIYNRNKDNSGTLNYKSCSQEDQSKIINATRFIKSIKTIIEVKPGDEFETVIRALKAMMC